MNEETDEQTNEQKHKQVNSFPFSYRPKESQQDCF